MDELLEKIGDATIGSKTIGSKTIRLKNKPWERGMNAVAPPGWSILRLD